MAAAKILDIFIEWNPNSEGDLRRGHGRWYGPNQELELVSPEGIPSEYIESCKVYYFHPFTGEKTEAQGVKTFSHSAGDVLPIGDKQEVSVIFSTPVNNQPALSSYLDPDGDPLYDISSSATAKLLVKVVGTQSSPDDIIDWTLPRLEWDYGEVLGPDFQAAQAKYLHRERDENESFEDLFVSVSPAPNAVVQGYYDYSFEIGEVLDAGTHILTATFTPTNQPFRTKYNTDISPITKEISVTVNPIAPVIQWDTVQKSGAASKGRRFIPACEVVSEETPYITDSQNEYPDEALSPVDGSVGQGDPVPGVFEFFPRAGTPIFESTDISATFTPLDPNYREVAEVFSFLVPEKTETDLSVPTLFNGLVVSVDCNVGFGGDTSNCSFTVVDDPDNGFITDIPTAGTACYFRYKGFFFGGILQRWNYSESVTGKKYNITLSSPSAFMDGVHIILSSYEGTAYHGDTNLVPWTGAQVPYQEGLIRNVLNPLGYFENYTLGLLSGDDNDDTWLVDDSLIDDFGFGTWGDAGTNPQGFDGIKLLKTIEVISKGGTPHGDKLFFGESQYSLDLSELIDVTPEYYRISASPSMDLNSLVAELCDLTQRDYIWEVTGETNDVCKDIGEPFVDQDNVVLKVKLIDKSSPPDAGVIAQYVEDAKDAGNLVNSSVGKEFQNESTQKIVLGGKATRYFLADQFDMIPIYGRGSDGSYLLPKELKSIGQGAYDIDQEVTLYPSRFSGGPGDAKEYTATIFELRVALSGFDSWCAFKWTEMLSLLLDGPDLGTKGIGGNSNWNKLQHVIGMVGSGLAGVQSTGGIPPAAAFQNLLHVIRHNRGQGLLSFQETSALQAIFDGYTGSQQGGTTSPIFQGIADCAFNYFGQKFLIRLPEEPGGIENNLKVLKEDVTQIPSWSIADAAWVENAPISSPDCYDSTGKLKAVTVYANGTTTDGKIGHPYSSDIVQGMAYQELSFNDSIDFVDLDGNGRSPFLLVDTGIRGSHFDLYSTNDHALEKFLMMNMKEHLALSGDLDVALGNKGINGMGSHMMIPDGVVAPLAIGIPQESERYSWGPWYNSNHSNGKLDFIYDSQLAPESFGSIDSMSEMAQAQADTGIATMEEVENGSIEVAEFPEYNIGDRLLATGPYVTNISIKIGVAGMTTSYRFNTWTPDFGRLQKYNQARVARIWRNKMSAAKKKGGSTNMRTISSQKDEGQLITRGGGSEVPGSITPMSSQMSAIAGNTYTSDTHQEIANVALTDLITSVGTDPNGGPTFDHNFGCSIDQAWVGFSTHENRNENQFLSSVQDPDLGNDPEIVQGDDSSDGTFNIWRGTGAFLSDEAGEQIANNGSIMPTSNDLDPYFNYSIYLDDGAPPVIGNDGEEEEEPTEENPSRRYMQDMARDFQAIVHTDENSLPETLNMFSILGADADSTPPMYLSDYKQNENINSIKEFRPAGLRGPLVVSGWGYDVANNPVPHRQGGQDAIRHFALNVARERQNWKTGPVNLMWDKERKIWSGGLETLTGTVETDIESPDSPMRPTTFNLKVLRKVSDQKGDEALDYNDPPEIIKCYNRDPNFSMTAGENSYLTVMRINYEWVPLGSGGGGVDLVSFETQEPEEECETDTQVWWLSIERLSNADQSNITNPANFPRQSEEGFYDWEGFQPKKPERHLDYCQNEGASGSGEDVWRDNTTVIYHGKSLDDVATQQGEGKNMEFWMMKTCYPRPGYACAEVVAVDASQIEEGDYFGIRDSYTPESGSGTLVSELDTTLPYYFYFVIDSEQGDLSDDDFSDDNPPPPPAEISGFPNVPVFITNDMVASEVAQAIEDAWANAVWTYSFTLTRECEKITICQVNSGLTGDQSNEGLSQGNVTATNFTGGEGFDAETWLAANYQHMIDWINLEENASYFIDGAPNDAWVASGGAWSGPTTAPSSGTGTIYEGGINRDYGNSNSLRRDDWLDMRDILGDMSGYLGSHLYTIIDITNNISGSDENGIPYLSDCDEVDRRCTTIDGIDPVEEIIGRITQYPCGTTSVPDEISVNEEQDGPWVEVEEDESGGYIKIRDPMQAFFPRRLPSDLRGRRGVAMRVWDYLPNGPCQDDPDSEDFPSECYWMVIYMDMFDQVELVHDIIIGTRTITTKKKKIDVWNHCDLPDHIYQGEDCTFEEDDD